jgi:hypothetical protein
MLNWSFILNRIKDDLSLPNQPLEKTDDEIIDYLKRNALKKFEKYFPDRNIITLNTADESVQVSNKVSTYYLFDPDDREILNVVQMDTNSGDLMVLGHNIWGAWSYDQITDIALANSKARNTKPYSMFNYTTEFLPPNMIRILPKFSGTCAIEYERSHDPELSTIEPSLQDYFVDLCLGMIEMWIGKIRQKYTSYNTPFGEIQLNADVIFNDGKDLYDKTIEKLESGSIGMNIRIDVG